MTQGILVFVLMVLLPIVPAFILFRYLPSKAVAHGTMQGFTFNLGGAIGGYFVILAFIVHSFDSLLPDKYAKWTVQGRASFDDHAGVLNDDAFLFQPAARKVTNDFFTLTTYAKEVSDLPVSLQIRLDGYVSETRELQKLTPKSDHLIDLGTIMLKRDRPPTDSHDKPLQPKK